MILKADGTPVTFYLGDLDYTFNYNVKLSINYGAQMGACLAMFFVLAVLTKAKNRSHPLFTLNLLSLLFGFLRTLLLALYGVSDWVKAYPYWTGDWSAIPRSAYTTSIAGVVMSLLMAITINMSLVLQAHAVCKAMDRIHTYVIVGVSCIVLLLTVGFRFAQVVTNCLAIINLETYFAQAWIQIGTLATETTSIWWFSIIFIGKLVWTLYNRKRQGWKQWSAVRVLATMGGCTMIIPCQYPRCNRLFVIKLTLFSDLRCAGIHQWSRVPRSRYLGHYNGRPIASSLFSLGKNGYGLRGFDSQLIQPLGSQIKGACIRFPTQAVWLPFHRTILRLDEREKTQPCSKLCSNQPNHNRCYYRKSPFQITTRQYGG
jgi:hypothetical protein